jgi:hypothetical protein
MGDDNESSKSQTKCAVTFVTCDRSRFVAMTAVWNFNFFFGECFLELVP